MSHILIVMPLILSTSSCNEVVMQEAIYKRGPVAVAFMAYDDFRGYRKGVYIHNGKINDNKSYIMIQWSFYLNRLL